MSDRLEEIEARRIKAQFDKGGIIDAKELAEIEARANAATPGPWRAVDKSVRTDKQRPDLGLYNHAPNAWDGGICNTIGGGYYSRKGDGVNVLARDNAAFIAHARTDIPWLIARVRELEAQAALDATVVEAIGPYREADSAVTRAYNRYVASKGTSEEAVAEFDLNWTRGVFVGYERVLDDALDAALAARKGMT